MNNQSKEKSLLNYIFEYAGEYQQQYIKSLVLAVIGVIFSLLPYFLMGDMVKKLLSGERDFKILMWYNKT